jgi:O-antigen ligase
VKPSRNQPRRPSPAASKGRKAAAPAAPAKAPLDLRLAMFLLWLLILVPPFVFYPIAKESFRQPKLLVSGWLALASLLPLAAGLRRLEVVAFSGLFRSKAFWAILPLVLVASAGVLTTRHPLHVEEALTDLWIGTACLVGWSLALSSARLERLLSGLLLPATLLGAIGILQATGVWQPLAFFGIDSGSRLAMTSTAGNPGDLGAYLVLPCLLAQWRLLRALRAEEPPGPGALAAGGPLAVCLVALILSQTLAALAALAAGSLLFWALVLPRRRALLAGAGLAAAAVVLVLAVAPLRERVVAKSRQALAGDWNAVLTNRLDGWRTALFMLERNPLTGVGHGAYRPEFVPAKLALLNRGAEFSPDLQQQVVFANAHNEYLEAGAEWGIPGLLALAWGLGVLVYALRRGAPPPGDRALAWAGTAALAVLALAHFPFRIALVAFPALLFLSWVLRRSAGEEA